MTKNKIFLLTVSVWITFNFANATTTSSEILVQAEKLQQEKGNKAAIDFLWSNSEKLQRSEYLLLAITLTKEKNFKDILKVSELALAKYPQDAEFLTFQGKAYLETQKDRKKLEKAQESLRAAIEANPKFEPAYLILDDYYERQDKISRDLKKPQRFLHTRRLLFEDLIQQKGEKSLYLAKLCEINTIDGVNEQATKQCKRALELNPQDIMSQLNLAQVYNQTGEKQQAASLYKLAVAAEKKSPEAYEAYGKFLEDQKNYAEAYLQYKDCLTHFSNRDNCMRGLASSSASLKKWSESYNTFHKLCRKDRKWSVYVRKASAIAKELGARDWEQKFLELSLNCNI